MSGMGLLLESGLTGNAGTAIRHSGRKGEGEPPASASSPFEGLLPGPDEKRADPEFGDMPEDRAGAAFQLYANIEESDEAAPADTILATLGAQPAFSSPEPVSDGPAQDVTLAEDPVRRNIPDNSSGEDVVSDAGPVPDPPRTGRAAYPDGNGPDDVTDSAAENVAVMAEGSGILDTVLPAQIMPFAGSSPDPDGPEPAEIVVPGLRPVGFSTVSGTDQVRDVPAAPEVRTAISIPADDRSVLPDIGDPAPAAPQRNTPDLAQPSETHAPARPAGLISADAAVVDLSRSVDSAEATPTKEADRPEDDKVVGTPETLQDRREAAPVVSGATEPVIATLHDMGAGFEDGRIALQRLGLDMAAAAEQSARAPRDGARPARADHQLLGNVGAALRTASVDETGKTTLKLRPQGLGLIEIELSRDQENRIHMSMRVQNPMVLDAIQSDRQLISGMLENSGRSIAGFDLSGFDRGGREDQKDQGTRPGGGRSVSGPGPETQSAAEAATELQRSAPDRVDMLI